MAYTFDSPPVATSQGVVIRGSVSFTKPCSMDTYETIKSIIDAVGSMHVRRLSIRSTVSDKSHGEFSFTVVFGSMEEAEKQLIRIRNIMVDANIGEEVF